MRDHPHACGDKADFYEISASVIGSSPRVWGQDWDIRKPEYEKRIIPTRVGTSLKSVYNAPNGEDHPHACGDKYKLWKIAVKIQGSSPRVWGQAQFMFLCSPHVRIIPTRVGTRI